LGGEEGRRGAERQSEEDDFRFHKQSQICCCRRCSVAAAAAASVAELFRIFMSKGMNGKPLHLSTAKL
jgi:hypothetical protein